MRLFFLAGKQSRRKHSGNGALVGALALIAGLLFVGTLAMQSLAAGISLGAGRLGADLMIVPEGCDEPSSAALVACPPSALHLPGDILKRVLEVEGVRRATPQLFLKSADFECCATMDVFLIAFEQASDFTITPWLREDLGRPLAENEAIIGASIPVPAGTRMRYFDTPLTVAEGLSATGLGHFDHAVVMTMDGAREMIRNAITRGIQPLAVREDAVSAVLVELDPALSPERAKVFVEYEIEGVRAVPSPEGIAAVKRRIRTATRIIGGMGLALWPIAIVMSASIFTLAFSKRRREAAVLRARGVARRAIFGRFAAEAFLVSLAGWMGGLVLGGGLLLVFRVSIGQAFAPRLPWPDAALAACVAMGSLGAVLAGGVAAAGWPAFCGGRKSGVINEKRSGALSSSAG